MSLTSPARGGWVRIRWLRAALHNLDDEATWIAADDPEAARIAVERVPKAVTLLGTHPAVGRLGRVPGTRELIVPATRYIVPYRVRGEAVEILRVFHTSRRPPRRR